MTNALLIIVLMETVVFALGVLAGATWVESIRDQRSRRQAARQRELNAQARALREQRELLRERHAVAEDDMRWHAKRQAGLVVIDYEEAN